MVCEDMNQGLEVPEKYRLVFVMREIQEMSTDETMEKPHKALKYKTPLEVEKLELTLSKQTMPKVTESLDAKTDLRGFEPLKSEQTIPQIPDVLSANIQEVGWNKRSTLLGINTGNPYSLFFAPSN